MGNIHLNMRVRGLEKSATLAINEEVAKLRKQGKKIYSFGLGQSPFPVPESVVEQLRKNAHQKDYLHVQGLLTLRKSIANFHKEIEGVDIDPSNILVGPGSKELMFILQLCFYGDILIPTPSWVSYEPQANIIGRKVQNIPTSFENKWLLSAHDLEQSCSKENDDHKPRLLILNYPSNPCGATFKEEELDEIIKVARKYNIIILSDEIYSLIAHNGVHISIAEKYPENTILSTGLSKWCGAGGWRLGTFSFPPGLKWLLEAMSAVASETYTSVSAPIQYAAIEAFNRNHEIEQYLTNSRKILSLIGKWIVSKLSATNIRVHDVEGGFYILPDFGFYSENLKKEGIFTSKELSVALLANIGVATLPGTCFGMESNQMILRMSYVDFNGSEALKAVERGEVLDTSFLAKYCPNVLEGIEKMTAWLTALRSA